MLTASVCRVWLRIWNNVYDVVRCLMSPLTDRPQVIIHLATVFRFVSMWNLMSSHLHQLSVLFCQSMSNLPHPLIDAQKHDTQQNQNVKLGYWLLLSLLYLTSCLLLTFQFSILLQINPQTLNNVWRGILLVLLCDTCCTFDHYFKVRIT